jgi:Nif-specific regulatory protein
VSEDQDRPPYQRAEELRLAGDLSHARGLVQEGLREGTGEARGRLLAVLGRVNLDSNEYAAAAMTLEEAISLCHGVAPGETAELLLDLGRARRLTGDLDGALEVLQRAGDHFIEADQPAGRRRALATQGQVLYGRHEWAKAAKAFGAALELEGDTPPAWQLEHSLARTCERSGEHGAAKSHYQRAREAGWDGYSGETRPLDAGPAGGLTASVGDSLVDHDPAADLADVVGDLPTTDLVRLVALSATLNAALAPAPVLESLLEKGLAWTEAERGHAVVCSPRRGGGAPKLELRLALDRDGAKTTSPPDEVAREAVRWVTRQGAALFSADVSQDERLADVGAARAGVRSVACVPLSVRSGPALGALYLEVRDEAGAFSSRQQALLEGLARLVALAFERSGRFERLTDAYNETRRALEEQTGDMFGLVGKAESMRKVLRAAETLRDHDAALLLEGEAGTGKELVARAVHRHSKRREAPFVVESCGSLPDGMVEAELFGYDREAANARRGAFERASGGTLYLDDVSEMSPRMQSLLLRVLETGEIRPLGSPAPRQIDCRIVCASHVPLEEVVRKGRFSEDLFLRISVIRLEIPPLRRRRPDLPALVESFLLDKGRTSSDLSPKALEAVLTHDWPGNMRELRHALDRACTMAGSGQITPRHLGIEGLRSSSGNRRLGRSSSGSQSAAKVEWHGFVLNRRQVELLDFLKNRGVATNREYVQLVNVSVPTGWRDLKDLLDKDLIRAEGQGRNTVYRLSDNAPIKADVKGEK